jgi:hypothetical protein
MVLPVTAMYVVGLLIGPVILASACGWISRGAPGNTSWKEITCSFTLALVPIGFSMWLAHFSNHFVAVWNFVPFLPDWMPSMDLVLLDFGLLFTLYSAWRVARRIGEGRRNAVAVMLPWAVLAGALYSTGIWIVFQPMQMRGAM